MGGSGISADPKQLDVRLKIRVHFFFSLFTGIGSYIESELTESLKDRQDRTMCEELFRHMWCEMHMKTDLKQLTFDRLF